MIWMLVVSPLIGAFLNGMVLPQNNKTLSHAVAVLAVAFSFVCSLLIFFGGEAFPTTHTGFTWIKVANLDIPFELVVDELSSLMLLVVTGIGTLIHIYAGGYMHEEKTTFRFFSYLNLFIFMMLILVLGNNMLVMFVGWEGVGLCSYLLIGYWYESSDNAKAGVKAFVVNRIGDIGFLLGIFLTYKFSKKITKFKDQCFLGI